eukprot:CAMPEP_0184740478 /NCGR_PEP_ID=MMETSP0315-20130426/3489_1 /TAXON_ID=101924 /ORGANISM="Rhodosorus marinus, Strain UTEX LB 2760" /LENGTH=366 /DNA_ID=CAMNT_0027210171 /DNA_START=21 /DNA_END=1121 /DNA_ORIENTATION=+
MEARDFSEQNNTNEMWREGEANPGDFLAMEEEGETKMNSNTGENEYLLFNLDSEAAVVQSNIDYNPMEETDMVNVNMILNDADANGGSEFVNGSFQNSNWQMEEEYDQSAYENGNSGSTASISNAATTDWSTGGSSMQVGDGKSTSDVSQAKDGNRKNPKGQKSASSVKRKRGANSRENTKGKPKAVVQTAKCRLCNRETATNGANFKRHEEACMRHKKLIPPSGSPLKSSSALTKSETPPESLQQSVGQGMPQKEVPYQGSVTKSEPVEEVPVNEAPPMMMGGQRDREMSNRIRRLEGVISTIDVQARVSLRDSLVSLSNKAANPNYPRTPEQEELNRTAEYLVLRMLFSSKHEMHGRPAESFEP